MRRYDDFAVPSTTPTYPQLMEFSISNTCNLECIMCNGEWSSSIRSRREKKPPLPKPYSDRFFDDLREFLPHLKRANFLGGEPFLERETFRIWDMMIELGLETPCHVTTNGTQYNDKVERVLEALPFSFSISMDGTTKETVERIRQNAEFETLRENFKRFHAYCARRGTDLSLTYCLMTLNWHEFGDYLAFADDHGVEVFVNTVTFPTELSLYELPKEELERVVVGLENQHGAIDTRLTKNRHVWEAELARLRHRLDRFDEPRTGQDWGGLFRATIDPTEPPIREAEIRQLLHHWSGRPPAIAMTCDASKTILVAIADHDSDKVFPVEHLAGQKVWHMQKVLADKLGWHSETRRFEQDERKIDVLLAFGTPDRFTSEVRAMTIPLYGDHGGLEGTQTFVGVRPIPQGDLVHIS
jgi:molybdenum cofactor biosynthesis enzyme MoaA